jgi:uncharacterized membrane protein
MILGMKKLLLIIATSMVCLSTSANAACYADYKAKRDNPLQLHYGVLKLSDKSCNGSPQARSVIQSRIAKDGWKLLNVLGTFDESGLDRRRGNAGQYYLRY